VARLGGSRGPGFAGISLTLASLLLEPFTSTCLQLASINYFLCLHRYACGATPDLHSSIPLGLHAFSASSAPCPSVRPRRLQRASTPLVLHASTSPRLRHASRAPEVYGSMTPRLHACDASPELHTSVSTSPRRQRVSSARHLRVSESTHQQRASIHPCLYIYTRASRL